MGCRIHYVNKLDETSLGVWYKTICKNDFFKVTGRDNQSRLSEKNNISINLEYLGPGSVDTITTV